MHNNQFYPNLGPSAPVAPNSIYQQGDYTQIQSSQPHAYYQSQPIIIKSGGDQRLYNGPINQSSQQWTNGLCNCFDNIGDCCFAFFCPLCYQIKLFSDADETCCSCLFGGLVPLRTKIRTKYNIEGSICSDHCTILWCGLCSLVQMGTELKNRKM